VKDQEFEDKFARLQTWVIVSVVSQGLTLGLVIAIFIYLTQF